MRVPGRRPTRGRRPERVKTHVVMTLVITTCVIIPRTQKVTRKRSIKVTRFEMEIMDALWELGSGSIREVHESRPEKRRPAYTTVQTIIRRLEEKGAVRQTKQVGHAHIFEPAFTRDAAHRRLIDELLDLFGGSARPLMAHLAEA